MMVITMAILAPAHNIGLPAISCSLMLKCRKENIFCKPCKASKTNNGRLRNLPEHDPQKWEDFIKYNRIDVEVEKEITKWRLK